MVFKIISPNQMKTQEFSERIGDDYNIVHREDNRRQVVAGDWSVLAYFNFFKPFNLSLLSFDFTGMVSPQQELEVKLDGIYVDNGKRVLNVELKDSRQINISNIFEGNYKQSSPRQKISSYFPKFDSGLAKLLQHYCLASGDIGKSIIPNLMNELSLVVNPKKKLPFMYGSSLVSFDLTQITSNSRIERVLLNPVVDLDEKARGNIFISYILQNQSGITVGYFQKTIITKGLMFK